MCVWWALLNICSPYYIVCFPLSLSLSLSLPLPPVAGIPLTSNDAVIIRQFELATVVCDGTETNVLGCTISKNPASFVSSQALVRCFQQTGIYTCTSIQLGACVYILLNKKWGTGFRSFIISSLLGPPPYTPMCMAS